MITEAHYAQLATSIEQSIDKIESHDVFQNAFNNQFRLRDGQKSAIKEIILAFASGSHGSVVLDAPTGSGKSIIAMFCSLFFNSMGKQGYLLASDLMLQQQYQKDFDKFKFVWGNIKGVDNYICDINGEPFSTGDCRSRNMTRQQAAKLACYKACGYYSARAQAISSNTTLMNYSYWLLQMNYVMPRMFANAPFAERDFTFFDEAHKIDDIVQGHFEIMLRQSFSEKQIKAADYFARANDLQYTSGLPDVNTFRQLHVDLSKADNVNQQFDLLKTLCAELEPYMLVGAALKSKLDTKYVDQEVPEDWKHAIRNFDRIKDVYCKVEDYIDDINETGAETIVRIPQAEDLVFKTSAERSLIRKHLIQKSNFRIFMSATVGDPNMFCDIMAINEAKILQIPSDFNFTNSKIYQMGSIRLSYKERDKNLPFAVANTDVILERFHPNHRGIIHTGSYAFMQYLLENSRFSDRLITYKGSHEKEQAIEALKERPNGILIGPSIIEGLDLNDENCRFQIFFKVPYPNLSDPLIKAKIDAGDGWYRWKTLNNFLQGIGRGIRHKDDWSVTYLIDGCFHDIIWKDDIPKYVSERLTSVKL